MINGLGRVMEKEIIENNDDIDGHSIKYQIKCNIDQTQIWGRYLIKGPPCSTANTASMESELKGRKFNSVKEAKETLKREAYKKIKQANYIHPSIRGAQSPVGTICFYSNRKIEINDAWIYQ